MQINDPRRKLQQIKNENEKRAILSLLDIVEGAFGVNFTVNNGTIVELQMVATNLGRIPLAITELPNLYRLHLEANKIKSLRYLDMSKTLKILDLSQNQISDVSLLEKLPNLQALNIADNHLSSLNSIANCRYLENLNASNNQIQEISLLPNLNRLKFLDLSGNPIQKLRNLHVLESLMKINLQNTSLQGEDLQVSTRDIQALKEYCRRMKEVTK
jgi:Leucine-rich repeat (LRR) protein